MKLGSNLLTRVIALSLVAALAGCGGMGQPASPESTTPPPTQGQAPTAGVPAGDPNQPVSSPAKPTAPPATAPAPEPVPAPAPTPAPAPADKSITFTTAARGAYSGVAEQKVVLITDEAGLKAHQIEPGAADLSKESILVAYMGEKNTGGYSIEITGVTLSGGKLVVSVRQQGPRPGDMVTTALTQPFHAVRIPKVPANTQVQVNW